MSLTYAAIAAAISYLIGSIPFGWIIARSRSVEIRDHGSGNIGATNVLRVLGKPWGITVFVLDALKGAAAVGAGMKIASYAQAGPAYAAVYAILAAAFAVIGHSFPVWLRFKGGKGVATSAGALIAILPVAAVAILIVWLVVFYTTRYVSLASIIAAGCLPIVVGILLLLHRTHGSVLFYFCSAMTALVIWRHRSNISRLMSGREPRFVRK